MEKPKNYNDFVGFHIIQVPTRAWTSDNHFVFSSISGCISEIFSVDVQNGTFDKLTNNQGKKIYFFLRLIRYCY